MKHRKDLSTGEKHQIVQFLLQNSKNGRINPGKRAEVVAKWSTTGRTVSRVWAAAWNQHKSGQVIKLQSAKHNARIHKRIPIDLELIKSLEMGQRSSIRRLAKGVKCSSATVGRWAQDKLIRAHTNAIKPELTEENKLLRLKFALEAVEIDSTMHKLRFKNMQNTVHIDEKWFYMSKGTHRFYVIPGETEPHRTCKSKKFIAKVMFMCAVCRPMYGDDGTLLFDGKIGMWPFTEQVPAKRASKNRVAGTMETKPIQAITRDVIRDCILKQILPGIKDKWPRTASRKIYIQQDNAKPHIKNSDALFREAAMKDGFEFILVQQPPNSPDTNINDLGWFRSIECLQHTIASRNVDQLVAAVLTSFHNLDATTLNNIFLTLQSCLIEIMGVRGGNNYRLQHLGKAALIRAGNLPKNLDVAQQLVRDCIRYLLDLQDSVEVQRIRNALQIEFTEVA